MVRKLILIGIAAASFSVPVNSAPGWEYKIIYLPGIVIKKEFEALADENVADVQIKVNVKNSAVLNKLDEEGWEVISITGAVGADHAVYLRRPRAAK